MERVQYYPSEQLKEILMQEAGERGISISQLTVEILMQHYGLIVPTASKKPLKLIINDVIQEVEDYVRENKSDTPFDLLTASQTFKNIHMVANGKPSTNRATVGKVFASKLGKGVFKHVSVAKTESGAVKKSINRATLYVIEEPERIG